MNLYLIKRGARPAYHRAPFHPIVLCSLKRAAKWEVDWSGGHSWLWSQTGPFVGGGAGWLLERWNGFDIDYGHVVRGFELPDGTHAAFWRDYEAWPVGVQDLLPGAVWWSNRQMPAWLMDKGVVYPRDSFTQQRILDLMADDGATGWGREIPTFWSAPEEALLEGAIQ